MIAYDDLKQTFRPIRLIGFGLAGIALLLYAASGLYVVKPEQIGVVARFGRIVKDSVPPGIHYHWPWPIEQILLPRTTEVRSLEIPFQHSDQVENVDGELLTGDENLVRAVFLIQYTIAQPKDYLTTTANPDQVLERLARWNGIRYFAALPVDTALTTGRDSIQRYLKQSIQKMADDYRLGIRLASVQLRTIEPPSSAGVADAFKAVSSAREDKQKRVEQAEGERNRRLPKARSEAQRMLRYGEAHSQEVVERAKGDSERFLATWEAYRSAKSVTAHRLYVETVESILPKVKLLIVNPAAERDGETRRPDSALPF